MILLNLEKAKHTTSIAVIIFATLLFSFSQANADNKNHNTVITALGQANGIALSCDYSTIVHEIKIAMVRYSPKLAEYRDTFFEATNTFFIRQNREDISCPIQDTLRLSAQGSIGELKKLYLVNN
jgi:hypothetical protein